MIGNVKVKGSLGCSDHEMDEFKILREAEMVINKLMALGFREVGFSLFGICLVAWCRIRSWREEKLTFFSIQGSPTPASGAEHPSKEEVYQKLQKTCMDIQRVPSRTQTKGNPKWVEAKAGNLGGIRTQWQSIQG